MPGSSWSSTACTGGPDLRRGSGERADARLRRRSWRGAAGARARPTSSRSASARALTTCSDGLRSRPCSIRARYSTLMPGQRGQLGAAQAGRPAAVAGRQADALRRGRVAAAADEVTQRRSHIGERTAGPARPAGEGGPARASLHRGLAAAAADRRKLDAMSETQQTGDHRRQRARGTVRPGGGLVGRRAGPRARRVRRRRRRPRRVRASRWPCPRSRRSTPGTPTRGPRAWPT